MNARRGTHPLVIDELVSPLRYDVLVRARLFESMAAAPRIDDDFVESVVADSDYAIWFMVVAATRFRPALLADDDAFRRALAERVRGAARLWQSFRRHGFDVRYPIHVRASLPGATTATGKRVAGRHHIADGCHRLALLVTAGWSELPPSHYRIDPRPLRELPDNTARLLSPLGVGESDYARFIGRSCGVAGFDDVSGLLAEVRRRRPELLADVERIVRVDVASGLGGTTAARMSATESTKGDPPR